VLGNEGRSDLISISNLIWKEAIIPADETLIGFKILSKKEVIKGAAGANVISMI